MISDEKRREVASRLRELPSDTYSVLKEWEEYGLFIEASLIDEADYSQIHDAVLGCFPAEHMNRGDYKELHERLADLIDQPDEMRGHPTCEMKGRPGERYGVCTRCGAFVRRDAVTNCTSVIPVKFCPNCGAEVVIGDE